MDAVSMWHGTLTPEGKSDLHVHPNSVRIYGLSGVRVVGGGEREEQLEQLGTMMFAAGETHFIANRSNAEAEVLVVSVPGLR